MSCVETKQHWKLPACFEYWKK